MGEFTFGDGTLLAGLFTIAIGLVEVTKTAIAKINDRRSSSNANGERRYEMRLLAENIARLTDDSKEQTKILGRVDTNIKILTAISDRANRQKGETE